MPSFLIQIVGVNAVAESCEDDNCFVVASKVSHVSS